MRQQKAFSIFLACTLVFDSKTYSIPKPGLKLLPTCLILIGLSIVLFISKLDSFGLEKTQALKDFDSSILAKDSDSKVVGHGLNRVFQIFNSLQFWL